MNRSQAPRFPSLRSTLARVRSFDYALAVVVGGTAIFGAAAAGLSAQDDPLYILDARLLDGIDPTPRERVNLVIRDGRIDQVTTDEVSPPAGATVIEAGGRFVLPGLIDAHSHVNTLDGYRRALESGVTTIRTAGVGGFTDVAMADRVRDGVLPGPDVLPTGVYVTPDIEDAVLADDRLATLHGGVRSLTELEHLVRVNGERGARWIKTRGTERAGRAETDPRQQVYNQEQLRVIVETAAEYDMKVMAHAHGDAGIRDAVLAGVHSIEHGTYASEETLQLMAERGTFLVPTLSSISSFGQQGDYASPDLFLRGLHMAPRRRESVARAYSLGIPIVTGVDTSYGSDSFARVHREVGFLVDEGVDPWDAIRGATSLAAELLGVGDVTGTIRPGLEADLILIDRNPLEDIRSLQDLLLVVSNGHVALNRLETIDQVPVTPGGGRRPVGRP